MAWRRAHGGVRRRYDNSAAACSRSHLRARPPGGLRPPRPSRCARTAPVVQHSTAEGSHESPAACVGACSAWRAAAAQRGASQLARAAAAELTHLRAALGAGLGPLPVQVGAGRVGAQVPPERSVRAAVTGACAVVRLVMCVAGLLLRCPCKDVQTQHCNHKGRWAAGSPHAGHAVEDAGGEQLAGDGVCGVQQAPHQPLHKPLCEESEEAALRRGACTGRCIRRSIGSNSSLSSQSSQG